MTIAILGGAGFIGTNLVEYLQRKQNSEIAIFDNFSMGNQLTRIIGKNLQIIEGDMTSFQELSEFFHLTKPKRVYHFVANSDIASASSNPNLDLVNTYSTTINLINCLKLGEVNELIFASSSAVYGERKERINEDVPFAPVSSYGWMKAASEIALNLALEAGIINRLLITRFPNVTGKYQTHGVVFDLSKKLQLDKSGLKVLGNGYQNKPYLSAASLVEIIESLLRLDWEKSLTINIAPDDRMNVRSIAELIINHSGSNVPIHYEESPRGWNGDIPSYELDTYLLKKILPDLQLPTTKDSILEGIRYMWDEYAP